MRIVNGKRVNVSPVQIIYKKLLFYYNVNVSYLLDDNKNEYNIIADININIQVSKELFDKVLESIKIFYL